MRTALKLAATGALGVFYLLLAYAAATPRVSAEYRDHYLRRVASCWLPDGLREAGPALPAAVDVGALPYPEACLYLRMGWRTVQPWGAWTYPWAATLRLPWRPGARAAEVLIRGPEFAPGPIEATLSAGGTPVRAALAPNEQRWVRVDLPERPERDAWGITMDPQGGGSAATGNQTFPRERVGVGLIALRYLP